MFLPQSRKPSASLFPRPPQVSGRGGQAAFTHETHSCWPNSIKLLLSTLLNTLFLFTYSPASDTVSHHASLNLSFLSSGVVNKLKTLCFFIYDAFKRGKFVSSINLHLQHSAPSCKTPKVHHCTKTQLYKKEKKKGLVSSPHIKGINVYTYIIYVGGIFYYMNHKGNVVIWTP